MKKPLSLFLLIITLILLVASIYFSAFILTPTLPSQVDEGKDKNHISFQDYSLPEPETIRFQNGTLRLRGWYFKHSKKQNCGMILLHGFSESKMQMLSYAPSFWKRGCSLFMYDARAHGESDGKYSTFGYHEKMDLERAVEYFSEIDNTPEDRIGIFGVKLGAATALQFADGQFDYGFIIADTSFKDMRSYVEQSYSIAYSRMIRFITPLSLSIAELRGDLLVNEVSPLNTAKFITKPVLLLHDKKEKTIDPSGSELIFQNLKTKFKKIFYYEDSFVLKDEKKILTEEYDGHIEIFLKEYRLASK
ncbi:dipeptidyl aminopeptidase [Leptospira biflexa]|uniref:alpha/beta hydrolase n=1 Tax=Leptospira biflexa TaxID=172 RepID=UPI0010915380|nr:dipeptidyl aminopeptidase [Leptospira biflexa]TGM42605.1 dipeptidyl aminopeptidase [Leptospira biflexa]TGM44491.1 dipeptidyl aminopeptidase [Leptospira biflexa]